MRGFSYMVFLLSVLLLSACGTGTPQAKKRFFFPPSPAEPRIEYLQWYFSDHDLKPTGKGFMTEYILGETRPEAIFTTPVDVASDGKGRVYVADSGARQVFVLDLPKQKHRVLKPLGPGSRVEFGFVVPFSVTVTKDGRLYISDVVTRKVAVFDENERYLFSLSDPETERPTAVAVDPQRNRIYVLDTVKHRLALFDMQGGLTGYLGERGNGPGQFNFPTDVDVDEQGHVYVLDALNARVQVFDETGKFLRMFGERGTAEGSFEMAKNLAVSSTGQVYVTDALAHKLVIFSRDGDLLLRIGDKSIVKKGVSPGGFYLPRGVDVDDNGSIWVVDSLNRMLHRFQFLTPQYLSEHPISRDAMQAR